MAGFDKYLKTVLAQAGDEARRDGSSTVEAQHLLLAMAADPASTAGGVLVSAGLDHASIRGLLDREFAESLWVVEVSASTFDLPPATPDPDRQPQPGASVQLTIERAVKAAPGSKPQPVHLLLGILQADVGTVPRALAIAGIDRARLTARIHQILSGQATR